MIQPFKITRSLKSNKFNATYISDSSKLPINERERFNVSIELDPWDNIIDFKCDCRGHFYSKGEKLCRHISNEGINPGLLQQLLLWEEITEVPEL